MSALEAGVSSANASRLGVRFLPMGASEHGNRVVGLLDGEEVRASATVLASADPRHVLVRWLDDERVELAARCLARMRTAALLFDLRRVCMAAAARLALNGADPLDAVPDAWIDARIDEALADLLDEDAIEERDLRHVATDDERYASLAHQLHIDTRTVRRAAVAFHRQPHADRAAFWAVLIDGLSPDEHAAAAGIPRSVAHQRHERAVTSFCSLGQRPAPDPTEIERSEP